MKFMGIFDFVGISEILRNLRNFLFDNFLKKLKIKFNESKKKFNQKYALILKIWF